MTDAISDKTNELTKDVANALDVVKKANVALRDAENRAKAAKAALERAERAKRLEEQRICYANEAAAALENTTLPNYVVEWVKRSSYDEGHSAGQAEVDMLTAARIRELEESQRIYHNK